MVFLSFMLVCICGSFISSFFGHALVFYNKKSFFFILSTPTLYLHSGYREITPRKIATRGIICAFILLRVAIEYIFFFSCLYVYAGLLFRPFVDTLASFITKKHFFDFKYPLFDLSSLYLHSGNHKKTTLEKKNCYARNYMWFYIHMKFILRLKNFASSVKDCPASARCSRRLDKRVCVYDPFFTSVFSLTPI